MALSCGLVAEQGGGWSTDAPNAKQRATDNVSTSMMTSDLDAATMVFGSAVNAMLLADEKIPHLFRWAVVESACQQRMHACPCQCVCQLLCLCLCVYVF